MARPKSIKAETEENPVTVKVTRNYFDTELNKRIESGVEFKTSKERARQLTNAKVAEVLSIKK